MSTSPEYQTAHDNLEVALQEFIRVRYPDEHLMLNQYVACFEAIDMAEEGTTMFRVSSVGGGPANSPSGNVGMLSVEMAALKKILVWGDGD